MANTITDVSVSAKLLIVLKPVGRHDRFRVEHEGKVIVRASRQPICDAARALHQRGYPDNVLLVARHHGADHDAISGPLGTWRQLRVREDRNAPRFANWEPLPSRRAKAPASQNSAWEPKLTPSRVNASCSAPGAETVIARLTQAARPAGRR